MIDPHVAPTWAEFVAPIILATATLVGAIATAWHSLRNKIEGGLAAAEQRQVEIKVALDGRLTQLIDAMKEKGANDGKLASMEATAAEVQRGQLIQPQSSTPARSKSDVSTTDLSES